MNKLEKSLKRKVLKHVRGLGYSVTKDGQISLDTDGSKELIRRAHGMHRAERLRLEAKFIEAKTIPLLEHFANGDEVNPQRIQPALEEVISGKETGDLFRLASLLWSVPVSRGYGRRLRYLVRDQANNKLIGLIGLCDPVFNLGARDKWIGWDVRAREKRLCNLMDAFVLGAVPPYSMLLAGKLVAALVASREINERFTQKYLGRIGIISEKRRVSRLVLVTTTSALGRSSVYNRLKINGSLLFRPIGFTQGFGHFHIPEDVFELMVKVLAKRKHPYADPEKQGYRFGGGPNWRLRVIRAALGRLGLSQEMLQHGIGREVFGVPLAENWREFLMGTQKRANLNLLTVKEISDYCRSRWIIPRAQRVEFNHQFSREEIPALLRPKCEPVNGSK